MGDCPKWEDDTREHECPACFKGILDIVNRARAASRARIPGVIEVQSWHKDAFRRLVPLHYYAGRFRQENAQYPCLAQNVAVDERPAADYRRVTILMHQLCDGIAREVSAIEVGWDNWDERVRLKRLAMIVGSAIGEFIRIHPFVNGNGRMSRLLWATLLARLGFDDQQLTVVKRPAGKYGDVMAAAMVGDYGPAIAMVLTSLARAKKSKALPLPKRSPRKP